MIRTTMVRIAAARLDPTPSIPVCEVTLNRDLESCIWTRDYSVNVATIVDSVQVLSLENVLDVSKEIRMAFAIHETAS